MGLMLKNGGMQCLSMGCWPPWHSLKPIYAGGVLAIGALEGNSTSTLPFKRTGYLRRTPMEYPGRSLGDGRGHQKAPGNPPGQQMVLQNPLRGQKELFTPQKTSFGVH